MDMGGGLSPHFLHLLLLVTAIALCMMMIGPYTIEQDGALSYACPYSRLSYDYVCIHVLWLVCTDTVMVV